MHGKNARCDLNPSFLQDIHTTRSHVPIEHVVVAVAVTCGNMYEEMEIRPALVSHRARRMNRKHKQQSPIRLVLDF
jgi:hypothetical protein